jgi:hypothetical protein
MQGMVVFMKDPVTAPIALFIFNRPDLTARVFEQIRLAKPPMLLVVADGPRSKRDGEAELCTAARRLLERVDWPCDIRRNYSDVNLGCGLRVSSGITWVFEQTDRAIILEDDCLPHATFFSYAQELLERYANEDRVMHIGGNNFQNGQQRGDASYFFSKYGHIWGWATWRRAWQYYDFEMKQLHSPAARRALSKQCRDPLELAYWMGRFERVCNRELDTWDYQWQFSCWLHDGLATYPNVNVVSNIGFGPDATHTTANSTTMNLPTHAIGPMNHPTVVAPNKDADSYTFDHIFGGTSLRSKRTLRNRVYRRLAQSRISGLLKDVIGGK